MLQVALAPAAVTLEGLKQRWRRLFVATLEVARLSSPTAFLRASGERVIERQAAPRPVDGNKSARPASV